MRVGHPGCSVGEVPCIRFTLRAPHSLPCRRQLLLVLAEHLCEQFNANVSSVIQMLASLNIALIPTLNPDGFDAHARANRWDG